VDEAACRAAGVPVLRRASGGGLVLWDAGLLSLDAALPRGHRLAPDDVVAAYEWLGRAAADGLRRLGVPAEVVGIAEARAAPRHRLAARACFGALSPFEVVAGGRKVVGLAQVRRRSGALLQAGFALRLDAGRLAALLDLGPERESFAAALRDRAAGQDEVGPAPRAPAVIAAVEAALAERQGIVLGEPSRVAALTEAQ
jgi:lipoate-protein ligase A